MQRELAQLNTPSSLREVLPETSVARLRPGTVRSAEPERELKKQAGRVVELHLVWMQNEEYPAYQAVLRPPGTERSYTIPDLTVEHEHGKFIRVRLPIHELPRGNYQIDVTGIAANGSKSPSEIYSFTVSD